MGALPPDPHHGELSGFKTSGALPPDPHHGELSGFKTSRALPPSRGAEWVQNE